METNQQTQLLDYKTSNFAVFLEEAMRYIEANTHTFIQGCKGETIMTNLLHNKLKDLCIPHKIFKINLKCDHLHTCILVDNTIYTACTGIINCMVTKDQLEEISEEKFLQLLNRQEDGMFDGSCEREMQKLFDSVFTSSNIGSYQVGSLELPENGKVGPSEGTRRKMLEKMKNSNHPLSDFLNKLMGDNLED